MYALGASVPMFSTCPPCSVLKDGSCDVCEDGSPHPSCKNCVAGELQMPWYQQELVVAVGSAVVVSVISTIIAMRLRNSPLFR